MIVAVKRGKSVKGAGIQTIHSKRYALLVSAGQRITVVKKTLPDNQGVVRKAVVKTKTGEYLRPVIKLCVISESNPQPE
jgi:hypothetical protein